MLKQRLSSLATWKGGVLLRLLPIGLLSLLLLLFNGVALAAPQASAQPAAAPPAAGSQAVGGAQPYIDQVPAADPICESDDTSDECANHLTTKLGDWAGVAYQVGIWVAVAVALLVIIWTTPGAIFAAANNNSKMIGQLVVRIAIIAGLILLAINAQSLLDVFLGGATNTISKPTFPTLQP